jgi:hypothetical protein
LIYQSCEYNEYFDSAEHKTVKWWAEKVATIIVMKDSKLSAHPWMTSCLTLINDDSLDKDEIAPIKKTQGVLALKLIKKSKRYDESEGWEIEG